jgi:hypothetical protein
MLYSPSNGSYGPTVAETSDGEVLAVLVSVFGGVLEGIRVDHPPEFAGVLSKLQCEPTNLFVYSLLLVGEEVVVLAAPADERFFLELLEAGFDL